MDEARCVIVGTNGKECGLPLDDGHRHGVAMTASEYLCEVRMMLRSSILEPFVTYTCSYQSHVEHTKHHDPVLGDWEINVNLS